MKPSRFGGTSTNREASPPALNNSKATRRGGVCDSEGGVLGGVAGVTGRGFETARLHIVCITYVSYVYHMYHEPWCM